MEKKRRGEMEEIERGVGGGRSTDKQTDKTICKKKIQKKTKCCMEIKYSFRGCPETDYKCLLFFHLNILLKTEEIF